MHTRPVPPPWNEVLRSCASRELPVCAFGAHVDLVVDRHEPRAVGLILRSGERSLDLEPAFVCPCGAMALGRDGVMTIDDLAGTTGAARYVDVLVSSLRTARTELASVTEPLLRTVATGIHAELLCKLAVHATRWNLPPYDSLGRTRAKPTKCWHVR